MVTSSPTKLYRLLHGKHALLLPTPQCCGMQAVPRGGINEGIDSQIGSCKARWLLQQYVNLLSVSAEHRCERLQLENTKLKHISNDVTVSTATCIVLDIQTNISQQQAILLYNRTWISAAKYTISRPKPTRASTVLHINTHTHVTAQRFHSLHVNQTDIHSFIAKLHHKSYNSYLTT